VFSGKPFKITGVGLTLFETPLRKRFRGVRCLKIKTTPPSAP
jgi:hypothetical protein